MVAHDNCSLSVIGIDEFVEGAKIFVGVAQEDNCHTIRVHFEGKFRDIVYFGENQTGILLGSGEDSTEQEKC